MTNTIKLSAILNLGRHWAKGRYDRVYIDASATLDLAGYRIRRYKSGNIAEAYDADGDKISNSEAYRRITRLNGSYYDNILGRFSVDVADILGVKIIDDVNTAEELEAAKEKAESI